MGIFETVGTIAFAVSGAMIAISKEMDLFGTIILAITTAVGGGVVRDIIIGNTPPTAFMNPHFCTISLITALIVFKFYYKLNKFKNLILITDAIGLGAFTAIGNNVAINNNYTGGFIIIVLGLFTGIGGGVLRDIFAKEIPFVFKKEIYGVASILGGISIVYLRTFFSQAIASYICFFVTLFVRLVSVKYGINLPAIKQNFSNI
ncbi:trimeric intracellular cation channel family protein [Clostridium rectalis]|uniref:trimeric intracellular cation channel family protein n=1 Tax=Clostridium rectalis TaxID=2040295 RepID=UPI001FA985DD|nr:trimeric intracellular cation channel family protein [Clostridium rectalis]